MTNKYIDLLDKHNLILVKDDIIYTSDKKGISPMMDYISDNLNLEGFIAYDIIVGKAVASLFIKAKIKEVYGRVMSIEAMKLFDLYQIKYSYKEKVEFIINRQNTGFCPMEETVKNSIDIDECYELLKDKISMLRSK